MEIQIDNFTFKVNVTHFEHVEGSYSFNADSDADYRGYTDLEYDIESVTTDDGQTWTKQSNPEDFNDAVTECSQRLYDEVLKSMK